MNIEMSGPGFEQAGRRGGCGGILRLLTGFETSSGDEGGVLV